MNTAWGLAPLGTVVTQTGLYSLPKKMKRIYDKMHSYNADKPIKNILLVMFKCIFLLMHVNRMTYCSFMRINHHSICKISSTSRKR